MIILEKETRTIKSDQAHILSHHIGIILIIQKRKIKTTEIVHRSIIDKLINQVKLTKETISGPSGNDSTETSKLLLNHTHCETTDDKNDTENTLIIDNLKIELEYETPIESNYYLYEIISSNPQQPDNNQDTINYTPHLIETNLNMNNIYQNTTNKILPENLIKDKIRTNHFF